MPQKLAPEIIKAAIVGFEQQQRQIQLRISELRGMLPNDTALMVDRTPSKRRKLSAAGRRRIAAAQKARWAKARGESETRSAEAHNSKRRISPEGIKRIVAATKKRWARQRAEAAKAQKMPSRQDARAHRAKKKGAARTVASATSATTQTQV